MERKKAMNESLLTCRRANKTKNLYNPFITTKVRESGVSKTIYFLIDKTKQTYIHTHLVILNQPTRKLYYYFLRIYSYIFIIEINCS